MYVLFVSVAAIATDTHPDADSEGSSIDDPRMDTFHRGGGLGDQRTALVLLIWTVANGLDQWYQFYLSVSAFRFWWSNWWSRFDCFTIAATFVTLIIRFYDLALALEMLSFVVLCVWFRIFKFMTHDHDVGPLVVMISQMSKDVVVWSQVNVIIIGAFLIAFVAVSDPAAVAESDETPLTVVVWAVFGYIDPSTMYSFNERAGAPLLCLYCMVMIVLMINLLLAILATTIDDVQGQAEEVWKMERLGTALLAIERWTRAPPPLNLPWTLAAFCKSVYKWCRNGRQPASEDYALDDIAKEKLSEMKMRKALTVESLVLKMHRQNDERMDSAVPDIVKDIAFDVDVLGDKADNLMAELKDMKDVIPVTRFSRRRSTVTSRLSIEAVSRSNLRRLSRQMNANI